MRVLYLASEAAPWVKVGGLADVTAALPGTLRRLGADVTVTLPGFPAILAAADHTVIESVWVDHGGTPVGFRVLGGAMPDGTPFRAIEHHSLYGRERPYDWPDDLDRFALFTRAALVAAGQEWGAVDVVHCHDWHTALAVPWLGMGDLRLRARGTVQTLHNLAFQGWVPREAFSRCWIPAEAAPVGADGVAALRLAIQQATLVNTVSPTYAREVVETDLGFGLGPDLAARGDAFSGILNGIDPAEFDPATDPRIPVHFDADDHSGKARAKLLLQQELDLVPAEGAPLLVMVARLTEQKGVQLLVEAIPELVGYGVQVAVLGTGDPALEAALREEEARHAGWVRLSAVYDEPAARRLYAGGDFFLMPSRFEPCGLGQMIALRYGTIPVVRSTGGLVDTVEDEVTGFRFEEFSSPALVDAVLRGVHAYREPQHWQSLLATAMRQDWSWDRSAREYLALYERASGA